MKPRLLIVLRFLSAGALLVVLGVLVPRLLPAADDGQPAAIVPGPTATPTLASTTASTDEASPTPTVTPEVAGLDVTRLVVPVLGIDAPIVTLGVDAEGTMQSPDNPTDVAWYGFSARPGERSNIVMAGHLDWAGYGPAVFFRLKDAVAGDELQLVLADGTTSRYQVQAVTIYDEATAPVLDIVGPTDSEVVTLITCGGSFDPLSREYDKRVVVRAAPMTSAAAH